MDYTDAQKKAIYTLDRSVAITAGAGAGKTRVLVDRYIAILDRQLAGIEGIVAITFTNRAAAEMMDRIRRAVNQRAQSGSDYWLSIKERLPMAYISTIHGFCGRLIRDNPVEAGVDPYFEIVQPAQASIWLDECAEQTVIVALKRPNAPDIRPLIMRCGFNDLVRHLTDLYRQIRDCGFSVEQAAQISDMDQPDAEATVYLLRILSELYDQKKHSMNVLDYEDMQCIALDLLNNPSVAERYHKQFRFIMVDECQDINHIQYNLIVKLAGDPRSGRLFAVGDAKQSIYRFRGAQVELFEHVRNEVSQGGGQCISMAENFRSTGGLISFINDQFQILMDGYENAVPYRKHHGYTVVEVLSVEAKGDIDERKKVEAEALAQRIAYMVRSEEPVIYDDKAGVFRAPRYGDIAVLFHKRTHLAAFEQAFDRYGIPYLEISGGSFYDCQEVKSMINALRTVAYPKDIIALAGTLKLLFGLDDAALLDMVRCGGSIDAALAQPDAIPLSGDGQKRLIKAANCIKRWRYAAVRVNLSQLLQMILDDTDYERRWQVESLATHKLGNLWKFCDLVAEAVHMGMDLYAFLDHIKAAARLGQEGEVPLDLSDNDAVAVMTVHSAKGLEFPIVAVPDLSARLRSDNRIMIFDAQEGIGIKPDDDRDAFVWQKIKNRMMTAQQDEYLRLMYVAFTRAKDRLILSSDDVDVSKQKQPSWWKWVKEAKALPAYESTPMKTGKIDNKQEEPLLIPAEDIQIPSHNQALRYYPVTPLITYMQCPRQYFYEYVLQLTGLPLVETGVETEKSGLSPVQIGNIVHRICERVRTKNDIERLIMEEEMHDAQVSEYRKRIEDMVEAYVNSPYFSIEADEVRVEQPFMLRLSANTVLTGRIDRMLITNGRATIIDFKSSLVSKEDIEALSKEYSCQLIAYAMAVQDVMGIAVDKAIIYYLDPNTCYEVDISPETIERTRKAFLDAIEKIEAADDMDDYTPCYGHCQRCSYGLCCNGLRTSSILTI